MEKKQFKKNFNVQAEILFEKFNSIQHSLVIEYSKNIATIRLEGEIIGKIEFKSLTGKALPIGAVASIFVKANISGGKIWREITELEGLTKNKSSLFPNCLFYFFSSSSKNKLFKGTRTNFFLSDNIEDKILEFLEFISTELLHKMYRIIARKIEAVSDILDTPNYYGQPEISLLLLCQNNSEVLSTIENDNRFMNSKINKSLWKKNKAIIFNSSS